ncbi:MAG: hypothetical protein JWQ96_1088 [Segetibacter sp.]|nr:hypothetical protein [Segetibacter sp.]
MALILNIDTATEVASVCLSIDGECIAYSENKEQREHASFLHIAVSQMLIVTNTPIKSIDAVAVSGGPGSYTGIRVGMATAKGFCFSLEKPLIVINTLLMMAAAAKKYLSAKDNTLIKNDVICPMIDARRMEVYTGLYDFELKEITLPAAVILTEEFLKAVLQTKRIVLFGSGSEKFKHMVNSENALFYDINYGAKELSTLSYQYYQKQTFSDLLYTEPNYLKGFFSTQ